MEERAPHLDDSIHAAATREPCALFVNTGSRSGRERFAEVREALAHLGAKLVAAHAVDDPHALPRLVRAAVEGGVKRVLVGGGDGTLSAAAAELTGRDVRMGVIPLGTGNDFARSLRIPPRLDVACEIAVRGEVRRIDVGMVNARPFLNAASVGLSSAITRKLSDDLKRRLGRAAFAFVAAGEALAHRPFRVTLITDTGRTVSVDAHQVVVGNGRYHGGGQLLAPDATHEDRALTVYVIRSSQRLGAVEEADPRARVHDLWNLFRVATLLGRGRHIEHPAVLHLSAARLRLDADPPQEVDVDGELAGETPVDFSVRPAALQVLVSPQTNR